MQYFFSFYVCSCSYVRWFNRKSSKENKKIDRNLPWERERERERESERNIILIETERGRGVMFWKSFISQTSVRKARGAGCQQWKEAAWVWLCSWRSCLHYPSLSTCARCEGLRGIYRFQIEKFYVLWKVACIAHFFRDVQGFY